MSSPDKRASKFASTSQVRSASVESRRSLFSIIEEGTAPTSNLEIKIIVELGKLKSSFQQYKAAVENESQKIAVHKEALLSSLERLQALRAELIEKIELQRNMSRSTEKDPVHLVV
ncbi:hypothetical protein CAGGBEG34_180090 [Candidatus Glomeribacter gigasporarum BEG34]|uniref:Uncharacterized protein n=1 Tax=Candidatus Glomeribacter gigasporarum BEG34 TaxID=1070319 RepID=G2J7N7_9BURK|nr:hypothetical protein [Candidatus Glomeribacter gigasporarum]CCD28782.1 hypothetical protein CAGGBEG34_180090 [Candidatus Glomeribacter gigasporarum BEG34]